MRHSTPIHPPPLTDGQLSSLQTETHLSNAARGRGREGVLSRLCRRAAGGNRHKPHLRVLSSPLVRLPWRSGTPHTRHPGGQGVLVHDLVHREERGSKTGPVYAQCTQHTKAGLKRRLLGESERRFAGAPSAHWQESPFQTPLAKPIAFSYSARPKRYTVVRYLGTSGRNTITRWEVCV